MVQQSQTGQPEQKLTKEQLAKLQEEFEKLPPEKKAEIIEQQCLFCQICKGQIETVKFYEDEHILGILDIAPATPGHAIVMPKRHFQFIFQLPDELRNKIFEVVSKLSIQLVTLTKAHGLNVHVASGTAAGQRIPHLTINVIPRFENDKLSFEWEGKKVKLDSLKKFAEKLREKFESEAQDKVDSEEEKKSVSDWLKGLVEKMERLP